MHSVIEWFWRGRALREAADSAVERVLWERTVRIGALPLIAAALIAGAFIASDSLERRQDLAYGKPWRASSAWMLACQSPAQHCAASPHFFFHTVLENRPWLEIDLGSEVQFSSVRVVNRSDCCSERAAPLAIETSSDHRAWHDVARRVESFLTWKATFPSARARWVRVRASRATMLHLQEVRVLR